MARRRRGRIAGARERLGWSEPPFVVPEDIRAKWRETGARGSHSGARGRLAFNLFRRSGEQNPATPAQRAAAQPRSSNRQSLQRLPSGECKNRDPASFRDGARYPDPCRAGTRRRFGRSTPSNNTKAKDQKDVRRGDYSGRYIRYGVREHGMASAMNGIAVHGGPIPYGGTFLTFSDYARPSIRLAAFMGVGVVYVIRANSLGSARTGPTHQPIEHLAALRADAWNFMSIAQLTPSRRRSAGPWRCTGAMPPRSSL